MALNLYGFHGKICILTRRICLYIFKMCKSDSVADHKKKAGMFGALGDCLTIYSNSCIKTRDRCHSKVFDSVDLHSVHFVC